MYSHPIKKHHFKTHFFLVISLVLLILSGLVHTTYKKPYLIIEKQESALNVKKQILTLISIGNRRLLADILWIQTLIESDIDHYKKKDLNSWLFLRFSTISYLDKLFYENYRYGGQYLAIVKDDLQGATLIFEKGIEVYPNDYDLRYNLGFTYYFELSDYVNGLKHLEKLRGHLKSTVFFESILNKMKLELGFNYDLAIQYLESTLERTRDSNIATKIQKDLLYLKIERDLSCLQNKNENCNHADPNGNPYLKVGNKYISQTPFKKYRLLKKGGEPPSFETSL